MHTTISSSPYIHTIIYNSSSAFVIIFDTLTSLTSFNLNRNIHSPHSLPSHSSTRVREESITPPLLPAQVPVTHPSIAAQVAVTPPSIPAQVEVTPPSIPAQAAVHLLQYWQNFQ